MANPNEAPLLTDQPHTPVEVAIFQDRHAAVFGQLGSIASRPFTALTPEERAAYNAAEAAHVKTPPTTPPWA